MAIELVTGLPGHGKTLMTIHRYREIAAKDGRQVFQSGIKELKLPWPDWEPERWGELEPGSILIVDEAQFKMPVRGRGEPPPWIAQLAVHRHKGVDLVLITQNPMLLDSFVRRLCDRHWHIVRKFGTRMVTMHEFPNGVKEEVAKSREGSIRHEARYPSDVFALYKSAELHTVKRRIPMRVWLLMVLPLVLVALLWFGYKRLNPDAQAERMLSASPSASAPAGQGAAAKGTGFSSPAQHLSTAEFVAMHQPRVPDLAYTAPVYDEVSRPVQAPYPAACVEMGKRCQCYTQQGTKLSTTDPFCRSVVAGGFFVAWQQPGAGVATTPPDQAKAGQGGQVQALGGAIGIMTPVKAGGVLAAPPKASP